MKKNQHIALVLGNEIWAEIMTATIAVIREAGGEFPVSHANIGGELYFKGYPDGITPDAWDNIVANKIIFKAPVDIPTIAEIEELEQSIAGNSEEEFQPITLQKTFPHVDITLKKNLKLYLDIIIPSFIETQPVLMKENSEQLSSNNDYMHLYANYSTCSNCNYHDYLTIANSAFNYAVASGIKKFLIVEADNNSNLSDVLFVQAFTDIGENYPEIILEKNPAYQLLQNYKQFGDDIAIIVSKQYGNLFKEIYYNNSTAFANPLVSIGSEYALFTILDHQDNNEAIQPIGIVHSAILLLASIGKIDAANKIYYALKKATQNGVAKVTISSFMEQIASYVHEYDGSIFYQEPPIKIESYNEIKNNILVGTDIFIVYNGEIAELANKIQKITKRFKLKLQFILSDKREIWPNPVLINNHSDILQLRFMPIAEKITNDKEIIKLLKLLFKSEINFISFEKLYVFDNYLGFSMPDR